MKRFVLILVIVLSFVSCELNQHDLRIENASAIDLKVVVGPADFGIVNAGEITDYKSVLEGSNKISGDVSGTVYTSGSGINKWTVLIDINKSINIRLD